MFGLAGFIDTRAGAPGAELTATATAMAQTLDFCGPDADGCWADESAGA